MKASRAILLSAGLHVAFALRNAGQEGQLDGLRGPLRAPGFRLMKTGEMVPHSMVDGHHAKGGGSDRATLQDCLSACRANSDCIGMQYGSDNHAHCTHRIVHKMKESRGDTCLAHYRALAQDRGFDDIPLVPLDKSDGTLYMREDCMDSTVRIRGNRYWGFDWAWEQPGLSLPNNSGYGVSPLLNLVTPQILDDVIIAGGPPWTGKHEGLAVDASCAHSHDQAEWQGLIDLMKAPRKQVLGRALIVDVSKCICTMLSHGWDPTEELTNDVVLLLHRDENFSPASPFTKTARFAEINTKVPCVSWHGSQSKFASDVEAFTTLANNRHVLGMYFLQTPPITHDKVFLIPLGVDWTNWVVNLFPHLRASSSARQRSRRFLYDVSHNLAVNYRRDVFRVVQENFVKEKQKLNERYVIWASGRRMAEVAEEALDAVFGQSPIGIGENCFRHAELLLAGAIPVVQGSLGVAAMRYLPHLAVSSWREVTPTLLRRSYQDIWQKVKAGYYSFAPLTRGFWQRHITRTAHRLPQDAFYAKFPNPPVTCHQWNCTG